MSGGVKLPSMRGGAWLAHLADGPRRYLYIQLAAVVIASCLLASMYHRDWCLHQVMLHDEMQADLAAEAAQDSDQNEGEWSLFPPFPPPPPPPPAPGVVMRTATPANEGTLRFVPEARQLPIFVISLDRPESQWNVQRLGYTLSALNFTNVYWWKATDARQGLYNHHRVTFVSPAMEGGRMNTMALSELGVRDSFRRLLMYGWQNNIDQFVILEDDAAPHCDLMHRIAKVMTDESCGSWGTLNDQPNGTRGVMMLGATCYAIGGNMKVKDENGHLVPKYNIDKLKPKGGHQCYGATPDTVGAFALLIRRDTIPGLLRYFEHTYKPFDHAFGELNKMEGMHVPVVYRSLFAPQLAHESSSKPGKKFDSNTVNFRMNMHRWTKSDYCGWDEEFSTDTDFRLPQIKNARLKQPGKFVRPAFDSRTAHMEQLMEHMRNMSLAQQERSSAMLPTVILSVEPNGERASNLKLLLETLGMANVQIWQGVVGEHVWGGPEDLVWDKSTDLPPREMGLLYSMREILKGAWFGGLDHVLVLQEDVLPHCQLNEWLGKVLNHAGCMETLEVNKGTHVSPANATSGGGALLLGYLQDTNLTHESQAGWNDAEALTCYETMPDTHGGYAVIHSRQNIPYTLRWMEELQMPYGGQWRHFLNPAEAPEDFRILAKVVAPNLFIPSPGSPVVSERGNHQPAMWDPSHYCSTVSDIRRPRYHSPPSRKNADDYADDEAEGDKDDDEDADTF